MLYIVIVFVLSVLYVWTLYNIPIFVVGVNSLRRSGRKGRKVSALCVESLPFVSIVVPVKDEETVVGRLLEALLKLDYPREKLEIVIVEDGSVDKTVEICKAYARRYSGQIKLLCQSLSNGKPSALNCALKHVRGEIVAVFDADSVPESDVLMRVARYFEDSSMVAVQGRVDAINREQNMLTKFISYEEAVRYETYIGGKDALKLFVPLTGSCYFIRRSVLDEVGGWDNDSLSEDMELTARLTERGYRVKYASDVRCLQENPSTLAQLFRQRARWFRGCMEVGLKYGKLVKNLDRRSIDAEVTLTGPFMFVPCLLGYAIGLYSLVKWAPLDPVSSVLAQGAALFTAITLFIIGVALTSLTKPRRVANLLWLLFIYAYWSIQSFVAMYALVQIVLRRPRKWMKTMKTGAVANHGVE